MIIASLLSMFARWSWKTRTLFNPLLPHSFLSAAFVTVFCYQVGGSETLSLFEILLTLSNTAKVSIEQVFNSMMVSFFHWDGNRKGHTCGPVVPHLVFWPSGEDSNPTFGYEKHFLAIHLPLSEGISHCSRWWIPDKKKKRKSKGAINVD